MAFTLTAPPNTDIWRKPPAHNAFNAPTHPSSSQPHPLSSFKSARLTFTLPPPATLTQYDQAGLLLRLTKSKKQELGEGGDGGIGVDKWLKTGVEFYEGRPYVSTVGCDTWADWSVFPLSAIQSSRTDDTQPIEATVEAKREGAGLWVYAVQGTEKMPLREVAWFFADEEEWEVSVAAYVAKPATEGEGLVAGFRGLEVVVG
jgi:regulation of enolase protein 1 (concanavalin A-like superfamily)